MITRRASSDEPEVDREHNPMELRCAGKLHGIFKGDHVLEVKCGSKLCGHAPGVVVLHRFDLRTGEVETLRFQEPPTQGRSKAHGLGNERAAIRHA